MRALVALTAVALMLAGCGGGPEARTASPSGARGATGAFPLHRGATGTSGPTSSQGPTGPATGPVGFNARELKAEAKRINETIYWAGPVPGDKYEFTLRYGRRYVRYLPTGVKVGARGAKYLIVATYPLAGAYAALKKQAHGKAIDGPGGSIIVVRPSDPRSVLLAFPNVDDEIEIYDPSPARALATAHSGNVRPVG